MYRKKMNILVIVFAVVSTFTHAGNQPSVTPKHTEKNAEVTQKSITDKVNLNTADAATLADKLNGVGLKKAQAIIEYREKYGLFTDVKHLVEVPGFGENLVNRVIAKLTL